MVEIILSIITFLFNTYLGLLVFYRNHKSWTNRLFLVLTILINAYLVVNYISLHPFSATPEDQLFWIRVVMFVCSFIGPTLLILVSTFPKDKIQMGRIRLGILILLCLTSATFSLTNLVFSSLTYPQGKPIPIPGPGIPVFFFDFVGLFVFSFLLLIYKYRKSTGIEKIQNLYFLLGIIGTFSVMAISTVIFVVILKSSDLVFLGPVSILIMIFSLAYAIIRHKFLDIRLIVARTVSFTILVGLSSLAYVLLSVLFSSWLIATTLDSKTIAIFTILTLFVSFSFQPLRRILEKISDKIFFKDKYNTNKLLYELALIMASTLRLEDLAVRALKQLLDRMKISAGGFILIDNGNLYRIFTEGFNKEFKIDKNQLKLLYKYETFIFDEISEGEIKEVMRQLKLRVVIPLKTQNEGIGILITGDKLSGDIYTSEDIGVLETLAPEIAIAIQNSKAYEEIKKFNVTLQEEVDKATQDLKLANERLEDLDKLKDDFVSIASHELRTPMTAIRSYVWMALHKSDIPLSQKLERYLYRTLVSTERLINLVNDMLNVSRIESGKIEIDPKGFDIVALVKDVADEVKVKAEEKKLTISVLEHVLPQVFADVDKVHQVLLNLVGNSLKFCYPSGMIVIDFFVDEKFIEVSIKDNGAGVAKEDLSKLFHKFSRLDAAYTSVGTSGGTGLGLYICKNLVELMHGEIRVSSEGVDKGATFTFSLPIATKELIASGEKYHIKPDDGEAKLLESVAI